ncbi:hypothetical protein FK178_06725 [Antarcticibacterium arcticum]|uniref:Uncharacterized protein n=1 Tax=Antarcticibacterium arcticum TaxID=2585771 RepID=A0A5B8YLB9_9FLAO|nr:hypothetical protein [Antarcticibacterium arcticum]QED37433.1 hypothetical protein FK178_06725 [Antarcticibacterium arcticum]
MKKLLLFILVALFSMASFGQNEKLPFSKEEYLRKSQNQKKTGWILLGAGAGLVTTGILVANNADLYDSEFTLSVILLSVGVPSVVASIPFFIISGNTARKAASISFEGQRYILPGLEVARMQPALTLTLEF